MLVIPLQPLPSQIVSVSLAGQACTIAVAQKGDSLFLDLHVDNALVIGGVICQNLNVIVRSLYLGFTGDLAFFDVHGLSDPVFSLIGTKHFLGYFSPNELPFPPAAPRAHAPVIPPAPPSADGIELENLLGLWGRETGSDNWLWG